MSIKVNPTNTEINGDLNKADKVLVFRNINTTGQFQRILNETINYKKNEVVYIHFYTQDLTYTVGLKEVKN